ncbi:MAG: hypothetical protein WEB00_02325 [Dehalococcoidia bacterium]
MVLGGSGADTLNGGGGADELRGGPDNDRLNGGAGVEVVCAGGTGTDTATACDGNVTGVP